MRKRKRLGGPGPVSGSSLLVIFAILCLTTFALLSLSTVQAHGRRMDRLNQTVADYYAADAEAQALLAEARRDCVLRAAPRVDRCSWTIPISDSQALAVEVELRDTNDYTVTRWQLVSAGDWIPDDGLSVWDGEDLAAPPEFND